MLAVIIVKHRGTGMRWDESYLYTKLLEYTEVPWTQTLTFDLGDQTVGPLYQVTHRMAAPLTGYHLGALRGLTMLLGLLSALLLQRALRTARTPEPTETALGLYAVPTMWVCSGLALSEMPAMLFLCAGLLALAAALQGQSMVRCLAWAVLAGLLVSIAIAGRTTYLAAAVAAPALWARPPRRTATVTTFLAAALPLPLLLFATWQGVVPPGAHHVNAGGIAPFHLILALAYTCLFVGLIAPRWLIGTRAAFVATAVAFVTFTAFYRLAADISYVPMAGAIGTRIDTMTHGLFGAAAAGAATVAAGWVTTSGIVRLRHATEPLVRYGIVATFVLVGSSLMVTNHFSSRHAAAAAPFLVLATITHTPQGSWRWIRLVVGAVAGLVALLSYY